VEKYLSHEAAFVSVASFFQLSPLGILPWRQSAGVAVRRAVRLQRRHGRGEPRLPERIPDVRRPVSRCGPGRGPVEGDASHPPFSKAAPHAVVWSVAYGGVTAFTVVFLKSAAGLAEGSILYVSSGRSSAVCAACGSSARALMGLAAGPSSHSRLRPGFGAGGLDRSGRRSDAVRL